MIFTATFRQRIYRGLSQLVGAAGLIACVSSGAQALSIELKGAAPDRIERQRQAASGRLPLAGTPNMSARDVRLAAKDLDAGAPVLIRIFKEESELEVWMRRGETFVHFATYPICNWSGDLGPKLREGDKQAPEGFYTVTSRQLRRSGRWPQALNLGFPNVFDRSMARTGSYILVHGGCTSVGCFAMTNPVIKEVFGLTKAAIEGGQKHVPVHVLPFRMSDKKLARHIDSEWFDFWQNLKLGYDSFERTHLPPHINVCQGRYQIRDAGPSEVGSARPLVPCGETAALAQAHTLLADVVSHRSRWKNLTTSEKRLLKVLIARGGLLNAQATTSGSRKSAGGGRGIPCKITLASCRRFVSLRSKRHRVRARLKKTRRAGRRGRKARRYARQRR